MPLSWTWRLSPSHFALSLSNRRVHYGADTLVGRLGCRIRPVFSGLGLDLLRFLVRLGVLLDRIALGFGASCSILGAILAKQTIVRTCGSGATVLSAARTRSRRRPHGHVHPMAFTTAAF